MVNRESRATNQHDAHASRAGCSLDQWYDHLAGDGLVRRLIDLTLDEDMGPSRLDLTSGLVGRIRGGDRNLAAVARARQPMRVCGLRPAAEACAVFGGVALAPRCRDGDSVRAGDIIADVTGPADRVTMLERTLLNLMGRLSGVATRAAAFVATAATGGPARVCDTRKTTPGLRVLEKYAVRCGGGWPHRVGLHDAVLVKDNHLAGLTPDGVGQLAAAVVAAARELRRTSPSFAATGFVEIEVDTLDQLHAVLRDAPGIDMVLLDNMPPGLLRAAVAMRDRAGVAVELEASGGVTLETIAEIAATGVDRISAGSITHAASWADVGLDDA